MKGPALAAITLDQRGGGVAAVSRLLWQAFEDQWPDEARLYTLLPQAGDRSPLIATPLERLGFATRVWRHQMTAERRWTFFSHLDLARVQTWMPKPWARPYAVFLHGLEVWRPLTPAQRALLDGAALRIANSRFTARKVREIHHGVGPIVECALALPHGTSPAKRTAGQSTPHDVLVVARMDAVERYKGHDQLLEAWPDVRREVPDARLVFVGHGDDAPRLQAKARDVGIAEAVVFAGFVSDAGLATAYERAAVFAMPSRGEGFGLVYLEAMSRGVPCIGSIHDAAGEVIDDGVTGYLVDQADRPALVEHVTRLLRDPAARAAMGAQAIARVEQHFTFDRFAHRIVSAIETCAPLAPGALAAVPTR